MASKTEIYSVIRYFVNTFGAEPVEGKVQNELSVRVSPFLKVSLEGRGKGQGIAIARYCGEVVAHEFHNTFVDGEWAEILLDQAAVAKSLDERAAAYVSPYFAWDAQFAQGGAR